MKQRGLAWWCKLVGVNTGKLHIQYLQSVSLFQIAEPFVMRHARWRHSFKFPHVVWAGKRLQDKLVSWCAIWSSIKNFMTSCTGNVHFAPAPDLVESKMHSRFRLFHWWSVKLQVASGSSVGGAMRTFRMATIVAPFASLGIGGTGFLVTKAVGSFLQVNVVCRLKSQGRGKDFLTETNCNECRPIILS